MINKTINGYTIKHLIGSGGMAEVYYAENRLGKKAAIKVLKPELCAFKVVKDRFEQEARIMVDIEHKHIRQAYDLDETDHRPAIVMEYLEGRTLKELIDKGKIREDKARKYLEQCVSALKVTHAKNIIHRDLKPANIFITSDNDVKILDFGIAKVKESGLGTLTNQMLGTPVYMSPEQIKSPKNVSPKSDVYSLAVTFYHALTGKTPYDSTTDSDFEIQSKIVHEELDLTKVSPAWATILRPMLVKDPARRISIADVSFSSDGGTIYGPPTPPKPPKPPINFKSWLIGVGIGLVVLFGGIWLVNSFQKHDDGMAEEVTEVVDTTAAVIDTIASIAGNSNRNQENQMVDDKKKDNEPGHDLALLKEKQLTPAQRAAEEIASTMVRVPGGSFMMGKMNDQDIQSEDYEPAKSVSVSSFSINKYEVTQEQWRAIMGNNPSAFENCDRCPVEQVSWHDIQEFIKKLNQLSGILYRLPTEAEWEFAAKARKDFEYAGSTYLKKVGWYEENSGRKTHPVGKKPPNGLNLYDMTGNVYEWCSDSRFGTSSSTEHLEFHIIKGCSWWCMDYLCPIWKHRSVWKKYTGRELGFRLAR